VRSEEGKRRQRRQEAKEKGGMEEWRKGGKKINNKT
jgi:hypothetical protein